MLDIICFQSIPNCLDLTGQNMLVIMTSHKPTCWKCEGSGPLSSSSPGKKAPGVLPSINQNPSLTESVKSAFPVVSILTAGTSAVKFPVGSNPTFPDKSLHTAYTGADKE